MKGESVKFQVVEALILMEDRFLNDTSSMPEWGILPDDDITIRLHVQLFMVSTTAVVPELKTIDDIVKKMDGFRATYATIYEQHFNITAIF